MRLVLLAASLGLMASELAGEVEVRQSGDRVSLMAVSAPVAEVLDRLARQTGMKVSYDAPPPRQLITAELVQRTHAEAVLGILEGLGLNYALVMDPAGARVDQLLILGPVGVAAPAPVARPATAPPQRRPEPEQLEVDEDDEQALEDDEFEDDVAPAAPAAPTPAAIPAPAPPDYPSSSFTPRLPTPATPPPPTAPPPGGRVPVHPQPSPNPR